MMKKEEGEIQMKKLIGFTLALILLLSIMIPVMAVDTVSMEQVVEKYNQSETVQQALEQGSTSVATLGENQISIQTTTNEQSYTTVFQVEGNNIQITIGAEEGQEKALVDSMISMLLVDAVQQLHGVAPGAILPTLNDERTQNYTLQEQGLSLQKGTNTVTIQFDIQKEIPLLSFEDVYITPEHLEQMKEYIAGDGSYQVRTGNVTFYKVGDGNEATITVGEEQELTNNAYRSILSGLQVMFGTTKASQYFEENYTDFSEGNKQIEGITIEIEPIKTEMEQTIFEDAKIVRLTIDKQKVNQAMGEKGQDSNTNNGIDNTIKKDESLPATGISVGVIVTIVAVLAVGIYAYIRYARYDKEIK